MSPTKRNQLPKILFSFIIVNLILYFVHMCTAVVAPYIHTAAFFTGLPSPGRWGRA